MIAFISYSYSDREYARQTKQVLEEVGVSAFLAHEDLAVSEEWKDRIIEELKICDLFIPLLSKDFRRSKWAPQEAGFIASRPEVRIAPLSIDGTIPFGFIEHVQSGRIREGRVSRRLRFRDVLWNPNKCCKQRVYGKFISRAILSHSLTARCLLGHYLGAYSHSSHRMPQHAADSHRHPQGQASRETPQALRQPRPLPRNRPARHQGLALQVPLRGQGEADLDGDLSRCLAEARAAAQGRGPQAAGPGHRPERLPEGSEAVEAPVGQEQLRSRGKRMAHQALAQLVQGLGSAP